jgi:hypothetical protein
MKCFHPWERMPGCGGRIALPTTVSVTTSVRCDSDDIEDLGRYSLKAEPPLALHDFSTDLLTKHDEILEHTKCDCFYTSAFWKLIMTFHFHTSCGNFQYNNFFIRISVSIIVACTCLQITAVVFTRVQITAMTTIAQWQPSLSLQKSSRNHRSISTNKMLDWKRCRKTWLNTIVYRWSASHGWCGSCCRCFREWSCFE